jgi:gas vesicle protein
VHGRNLPERIPKRRCPLQKKLDEEREKSVREWRNMITASIKDYGKQLKDLTENTLGRVTWADCEDREKEIRNELHAIRETCTDKMKQVRGEIADVRNSLTNHLEHHK